ncbi:MAG: LysM peptidoglycan-binding domain-containing protein [Lachnospiraceae bacterium]|nr:LysM peptidoglycan-binding domain-containing protein [Lachnospiraceae bacterium]
MNMKENGLEKNKKLNGDQLGKVFGGAGNWQQYAKGSYVNYGQYIVYTTVAGDSYQGIAIRFGVTTDQLFQWNTLRGTPDLDPYINTKLTIYPTIIR